MNNDSKQVATAIRPFHFSAPEAELTELRRRISATCWPEGEVDKGGHYAAWEQPQIFCKELRAAFKPLRT